MAELITDDRFPMRFPRQGIAFAEPNDDPHRPSPLRPATNGRFLRVFPEIETALRSRLGARFAQRVGLARLIEEYQRRNQYWQQDGEDLNAFREVRNFLTHHRHHHLGDPIVVTQSTVDRLLQIRDGLTCPRPIGERFCRNVVTVRPEDTLKTVLDLAHRNAFSQFPVLDGERFRGVLTETEVIRWLGLQVRSGQRVVDTATVTVQTLLMQTEPTRPPVFLFARLDAPEPEVMGSFPRQPALEVVLLTESGNGNTRLEGILTQWDAARYPVNNTQ